MYLYGVFPLASLDTFHDSSTVTLGDIFWFWIFLTDVVLVSSADFQKIFIHLVIFKNKLFTGHCSGQASEKWRPIKFHPTLYETQFIKNSCPCSTLVEWQCYVFITTSTFLFKNSTALYPCTSQCRKMVRHTLKVLQLLLQDF